MLNIAIWADGSPEIGMGHIMRCLSLAKAIRKTGNRVRFISRFDAGRDRILSEGFELIELYRKAADSPKDTCPMALLLKNTICENHIDILIVDSYEVSENFFLEIRQSVKKLVYIDDINSFIYPVDILINGNITGKSLGYKRYDEDEILLTGMEYNLIRDEFIHLPKRETREKPKEIMITTGGSDPGHMTEKILSCLLKDAAIKDMAFNVVIGSGFGDKTGIYTLSENHVNVRLYENPASMSEIMLRSDIAICAGGSTIYELCACGTPAIVFVYADNQERIVSKMSKMGYVESVGWFDGFSEDELLGKVSNLCWDYNARRDVSTRMQALVDGRGAMRAAFKIVE